MRRKQTAAARQTKTPTRTQLSLRRPRIQSRPSALQRWATYSRCAALLSKVEDDERMAATRQSAQGCGPCYCRGQPGGTDSTAAAVRAAVPACTTPTIWTIFIIQKAGLGPLAREQLTAEQLETVVYDIQYDPRKASTPVWYQASCSHTWRCRQYAFAHGRYMVPKSGCHLVVC